MSKLRGHVRIQGVLRMSSNPNHPRRLDWGADVTADHPQQTDAPTPPEQFMRLFLTNQRRFYGLILSLVTNPTDADDILQEVSVRMWQKYCEFKPGTDFAAWGLRFARFEAMNFLKTRRRAGSIVFN
jgi:DNA-directed RNA polymerase specialized sigma24 family protein